ncbi:hypothetical protein [Salipiger pallidus]|nr:hypothetical protein [Salipiger pallidus]
MSCITDGAWDGIDFNFSRSGQLVKRDERVTHMTANARFGTSRSWVGASQEGSDGLPAEVQTVVNQCREITELEFASWVNENEAILRVEYALQGGEIYELGFERLEVFSQAMMPVARNFVSRLKDFGLSGEGGAGRRQASSLGVR